MSDTINLNSFKSSGLSSIRFQVLHGGSYEGDVAIDDVSLLSLPVGIDETVKFENYFNVFPNPSTGIFNVTLVPQKESINFEIFDIRGKQIQAEIISANQSQFNFDLSNVSKGVYFLKLSNENISTTQKLIVK